MKFDKILYGDDVFFTGCTHFGHRRIITPEFCNRPWKTINEHDEALLDNWNQVVPPNGTVFLLGDIFWAGTHTVGEWIAFFKRLNGHIIPVNGNHDDRNMMNRVFSRCSNFAQDSLGCGYCDELEITVHDLDDSQHIVLAHKPYLFWNRSHYGSWHLFSHVHGGLNPESGKQYRHSIEELCQSFDISKRLMIDVGVDNQNYKPVSYWDIKHQMQQKTWTPPTFISKSRSI